ncbi:hypothetical protein C8F01DRAFT_1256279 [Mycena amicta]|nr:hypothetical protein C8F01DRAFT_1256279 [Mycena amicta]
MAGVDLLFGPMLLGVLLNTLLYGVMATQMLTYYIRFPNDFRWIRYFVLYLLLAETAVVVVEVGIIYQPLVLEYGASLLLLLLLLLLALVLLLLALGLKMRMNVIVATPIQLFTAWRIKIITQSYIAPVLIALLSIASFGGGLLLSFSVLRSSQFIDFGVFATEAAVWLISSAVCDIVLAVAMAYALLTRKTGIDKAVDGYINRIVRLTIESGSLTAAAALIDVILSISFPRSAMNFVVDFPLSTLYTCSLLAM